MAAKASGAAAAAKNKSETIINSDDIKNLIRQGKEKGFLSYAQINEVLPPEAVSPEKIDEMLILFAEMGIDVIDDEKGTKLAEAGESQAKEVLEPAAAAESSSDRHHDPVRMYLWEMGSVPLLTREGEVEIAKKIDEGEREVVKALLKSTLTINTLNYLAELLRKEEVSVKYVSRDIEEDVEIDEEIEESIVTVEEEDDEAAEADVVVSEEDDDPEEQKEVAELIASEQEEAHDDETLSERIIGGIETIASLFAENRQLRNRLKHPDAKLRRSSAERSRLRARIKANEREIVSQFYAIKLRPAVMEDIISNLKSY